MAVCEGSSGQASLVIAMIIPMTVKNTIPASIQVQLRGIVKASPYDAAQGA